MAKKRAKHPRAQNASSDPLDEIFKLKRFGPRHKAESLARRAIELTDEVLLEARRKDAALGASCARRGEAAVALAEARLEVERSGLKPEESKPLLERLGAAQERLAKELPAVCPPTKENAS